MPKSVQKVRMFVGNNIKCPYCDYSLNNNRRGMIMHIKASHNQIAKINPEKVPPSDICYCGKSDCKNYKLHQNKS